MRILAVGAHPDDLEILCAGTLAKYVQRGDYVAMAISTNGEVGSSTLPKEEIAPIRESEARISAAVIGAVGCRGKPLRLPCSLCSARAGAQ